LAITTTGAIIGVATTPVVFSTFNTLAGAIGGVGAGAVGGALTRRGRKQWTYGKKLLVPQYSTNPIEEQSLIGAESDNTARYITRLVEIPNGLRGKELKVYFDANIPNSSFVQVYAKTTDSTQFSKEVEENPYQRMTQEPASAFFELVQESQTNQGYSVNEYDYREASYSLIPELPFNTFIVKIVMYSTNETRVPTIKNLRIVAIE